MEERRSTPENSSETITTIQEWLTGIKRKIGTVRGSNSVWKELATKSLYDAGEKKKLRFSLFSMFHQSRVSE